MRSADMIFGFDVVKFIIQNYRKLLVTHVAEHFNIPVTLVEELYERLDITPMKIVDVPVSRMDLEKVKDNLDEKLVGTIIRKGNETKKYRKDYVVSETKPNRSVHGLANIIKNRPPAVYSNTSPYGIAKELHENNSGNDVPLEP